MRPYAHHRCCRPADLGIQRAGRDRGHLCRQCAAEGAAQRPHLRPPRAGRRLWARGAAPWVAHRASIRRGGRVRRRTSPRPWRASSASWRRRGRQSRSSAVPTSRLRSASRRPTGKSRVFEGKVYGSLVWPPRGDRGFGYDPMFLADGATVTFGEMVPLTASMRSAIVRAPSSVFIDSLLRCRWLTAVKNSASTCIGRSAPPSAPTATSTVTCAAAASTSRAIWPRSAGAGAHGCARAGTQCSRASSSAAGRRR